MPRTASTSQHRQSLHSRLRRERRERNPSETERTPVLLRLPEVELPAEELPAADEAYAIPSELESEPTYTDLPKPKPQPTTESQESTSNDVEHGLAIDTESTDAAFEQTVIREIPEIAEEPAPQLATQTIVSTPQTPATDSLRPEKDYALHSATEGDATWWEHWSSGVVLILLIIALVTASIIAFNDTTETDPAMLAESEDGASRVMNDELNELHVPGLEESIAPSTPSKPAVELPALELSSPQSQPTQPTLTLGPQSENPPSTETDSASTLLIPPLAGEDLQFAADNTNEETSSDHDSLLELPEAASTNMQAGSLPPPNSTMNLSPGISENLAGEGAATAPIQSGLQPPVTQPEQPLFPSSQMAGKIELPLPGADVPGEGLPNQLGSNQAPAAPSLSNYAQATQQLQNSQPRPDSYEQLVERQKQMEAAEPFSVVSSTGSPTISGASLVGEAGPSTSLKNGQPAEATPPPATSGGLSETATPDSEIDALIEAYRFFEQASEPTESNRYPGGK
ncbi:MAG: hypothetical protein ACE361_14290 [Aureliella sp.]